VLDAYPLTASFWGTAEPDLSTVLEGEETADVAVVGGGLAGLSSAYFLKRAEPDLDVVLLEQEYVGFGASSRNFGNVPQLSHQEIGYLLELLGEDGLRSVLAQQSRMLDDYETLLAEQSVDCDFRRLPVVYPAMKREHLPELVAIRELHQRFEVPSRLLSPEEVRDECAIDTFGALSCERNATVQPFKRARGFGEAVLKVGVRVHEGTRVASVEETASSVKLKTARGGVRARHAVFATNAFTPRLAIAPGLVRPVYTYVLATTPLDPEQLAEIGWSDRCTMFVDAGPLDDHYFMRVTRDSRFLIGGGGRAAAATPEELPPHDNLPFYQRIHREMVRRFPTLEDAEIAAAWGGALDMTANRLPVIAPISERCFMNVGFNGRGALITALSGKIITGFILGADAADPGYMELAGLLFSWPKTTM
jgi:gamma-glutamylputrescine oxidase